MRFFDLHCDTLYRALDEKGNLIHNNFHVSVEKSKNFSRYIECFAIWIPDEKGGKDAYSLVEKAYKLLTDNIKDSDGKLRQIVKKEDLDSNNNVGAIFTLEGSAGIDNIANIKNLHDMGIKVITLTWNGECKLGGGVDTNIGLTGYGKEILSKIKTFGIIPDVSHANEKLFYDVSQFFDGTFIATHSNSKSICSHKRNLTNEQFKIIQERGGIVGLNFCTKFLNNKPDMASIEDIVRHAEHFLSLGGENIVCIGSDFDGTDMPKGISNIESIEDLANCFLKHNYKESLLNKILFDNAYDFFAKNM